jgi:FtsZ-binding cell division protein ZapB
MTNRINFFGPKNEYDENQARERYLQYLRVAAQNSALKESAEFETEPIKAQEKPIAEVLGDEAEVSRVLQEYLGKLLIEPVGLSRNVNETDDNYQQRINPIVYVMNRLNDEEKQLILRKFQQILIDTNNTKMFPSDLINYVQNYRRLHEESGGIKGLSNSSAVIAEIRGLRQMLPDTRQLQKSINNLRGAQAMFKRDVRIGNAQLNTLMNDAINRLQNLENTVSNVDYDRIQRSIENGLVDLSRDNVIVAEDMYQSLIGKLERLPTRRDIELVDNITMRQLEGIDRNIREGRIQSQSDKAEILSQLDNAFTQIDSILMDKVNIDDLKEINETLDEVYSLARESQIITETLTEESFKQTKEFRDLYNEKLQNLIDLGGFDPNDPRLPEMARNAAIGELNRRIRGGTGIQQAVRKSIKKYQPRASLVQGRGIHIQEEPKFVEFGKYALSLKKLNDKRLDAKTLKSGGSVKDLSNIPISEDMQDILNDLIDNKKFNEKHLHRLSASEKRIFKKLINGSGLYGKYKVKLVESDQEQKENERYEMLKGIYSAGNDSREVIQELKQLIIKFMNDGRLPRKEALEIIYELNVVSM